ncbi:hypothetical protein BCR41DRAFT_388169 [Lobosporangium transversale]|uniref:Uncharacterized protein n=1 Tax=Lobosporangium transversale TaxID=64571 RepID=A0A1Y2GGF4_9FUNG|nr:hypothetical protein BCR41DRAFT_388169 [Lobosporangium transversale]ORZ10068.1 hypothetical protein BCR41DRAFT_388169 [Lobosporangium transversale]|eukprot:XP_021879158.1 hypothetical protein BCR41DRAFT_388169 [Lobosporangium transversale]
MVWLRSADTAPNNSLDEDVVYVKHQAQSQLANGAVLPVGKRHRRRAFGGSPPGTITGPYPWACKILQGLGAMKDQLDTFFMTYPTPCHIDPIQCIRLGRKRRLTGIVAKIVLAVELSQLGRRLGVGHRLIGYWRDHRGSCSSSNCSSAHRQCVFKKVIGSIGVNSKESDPISVLKDILGLLT